MQVEVERLPESRVRLTITVPSETVEGAMDRAFKTLVGRYEIPGFRKGKAPRPIFERYVGREAILREAAEQLVERQYPDAIEQSGFDVLSRPDIEFKQVALGEPLVFAATVYVRPEIDLGAYQDLLQEPLEVPPVTDELLEQELRRVAEEEASLVEATGEDPIAAGSRVVLSLKGYRDDEAVNEAAEPFVDADDYVVEVGRGTTVEGLESQLIGLHLGDRATLRFTYPQEYPDPSLAGQAVRFEVTIQEHKRRDVPEIDDELAKTKGHETLQEFKAELTNSVAERLRQEAREARLRTVLGKLRESVTFDVPAPLVAQALERQLSELQHTLSHLGATLDQYLETRQLTLESLVEEMRPAAQERVRDQLMLAAIAQAEGLSVSDDEVVEAVKPVAEAYQRPLNEVVESLKVSGDFEAVRGNLLVDKAADLIREPQTA
jgi:trigger factor